jgi:queuine tRNA-ribosyltransferase
MTNLFDIKKTSQKSMARLGELNLANGKVQTPVFMAIGTVGSVKSLSFEDLEKLNAQIILGNTYHLWLLPGMEVLAKANGLHNFINWKKPILTDSGGFQAWSLTKTRKFVEEGVIFNSHINGQKRILTPEKSMQIQSIIGSDISLVLDHVVNAESSKEIAKEAMKRTFRWAKRSKTEFERLKNSEIEFDLKDLDGDFLLDLVPNKNGEFTTKDLNKREKILKNLQKMGRIKINFQQTRPNRFLFGIPQGAQFVDLRKESAKLTMELDFSGYCVGGVAQGGEPAEVMYNQVLTQTEILEKHKPRHLLGVGTPKDIVEMTKRGIDMFDCVYPTRNARHGSIFEWTDKNRFEYQTLKISSQKFTKNFEAINPNSKFSELKEYSKAYLCHLFRAKEILAFRLATLNNLEFYYELMQEIRDQISAGKF